MGGSLKSVAGRAAVGVGLLVGFYVLVAVVLLGVVAVNVASVRYLGRPQIYLFAASALVVVGLLRSVLAIERKQQGLEEGLAVSRLDEPALWALVDETAGAVGTRPPDELVLVDDVNAGVRELGGLLGLRGGRRELQIGLGLLQVLDVPQLRAVLAHEMGHYSARDTRLGPVNYRGGASIGRAVLHLGSDTLLGRLFGAYARLYWRITLAVRRRQELSADATAVGMTGAEAFASSLRALATAGPAYGFFLDRYAAPVWQHGDHPADLYAGFRALLADPARQEELAELLRDAEGSAADPYDSHPSLAERLAAVAALPASSARAEPANPTGAAPTSSRTLLRDAASSERAMSRHLARQAVGAEPGTAREWDDVAMAVYRADFTAEAHATLATLDRLDGRDGVASLGRFLEALDSDAVLPLAVALTGDVSGVPEAHRTELQATVVKERATSVLAAALVEQGRASWSLSWSGPLQVVARDGEVLALGDWIEAAVDADGMTTLLAHLDRLHVSPSWRPTTPRATTRGRDPLLGIVNDVSCGRRRFDLLVFTDRFALVRCRLSPVDRIVVALAASMGGSARGGGPFERRWEDLVRTPLPDLLASDPRSCAVRWADVTDLRLTRRLGGWRLRLTLRTGEALSIASLSASPARAAVEALLAQRRA